MPTLDGSSPAGVWQTTVGNTAISTASFTPPSSSIIVAKAATEDNGLLTISSITSSGPTMTSRANTAPASHCPVALYTGTGAGASITVTANFTGAGARRALIVEVWTAAQLAGSPVVDTGNSTGTSQASDSITTAANSSVVTWVDADWSALDGAAATYLSSATQVYYNRVATFYTVYAAYQQAATAGAQTYGVNSPTNQTWNMAAIEIQTNVAPPPTGPFAMLRPPVVAP